MKNPFYNLLRYRDLFLILLWRNFSVRYKQSVIGVGWAIFQPLSMMILFVVVFNYIMPVRVADYPSPLFFYGGLIFWTYFASAMSMNIPILVSHYNLVTKIYFPKELLPFAGVATALVDLLIASLLLIGMFVFYQIHLTWAALWAVGLVFLLILLTCSLSLILSALNVFYRDVQLASNFLIQLWFFATPVFYSIDAVSPKLKVLMFLNPLSFIIENLRRCLIEGRPVVVWQFLIMLVFNIVIFVLSYHFFVKLERKFADVI